MESKTNAKTRLRLFWTNHRLFPYIVVPIALFSLALFSRLYDLSSFPFFEVGTPTCGGLPDCAGALNGFPGLYDDEATNLLASHSIDGILSNFAGGPVTSLLIAASIRAIGSTVFAVRFPFALISSLTAVTVYFTARFITKEGLLSAVSALYFIVMMPALIYGRMAFGENVIALLFMINIYATLRISESESIGSESASKWFLLAALSAAIGVVVKFDGIVIVLYFIVFLLSSKLLRRGSFYIGLSLGLGILLPLGLLEVASKGNGLTLFADRIYSFASEIGNQLLILRYFFLDTLPSSFIITWDGLITPEYWYIFLYVAMFALLFYNYREYSNILLALGVFVGFSATFAAPFGGYWMIVIQPILAIALGPGIKQLLRMPLGAAMGFYAFMFVPLSTSIGEYLLTPSQVGHTAIVNNYLLIWNLCITFPLILLLFFTASIHRTNPMLRKRINATILIAFFMALIVATFLIPDLYPYYIVKGIL